MEREAYIHPLQDKAFSIYKDGVSFHKDIENIYDENDYKTRVPDLLGKTVRVTDKTFPQVFKIISGLFAYEEEEMIPVYVYEDYYYGVESFGIRNQWIEISAKTIADFSESELSFVLAREVYKIIDRVTEHKTMMEQRFDYIGRIAHKDAEEISRRAFYHWYRLVNYSADNYGYLCCADIESAVSAIMKMVLNSVSLAEKVNIRDFIDQASEIDALDDATYNDTKQDELIPYAPHRILGLLAYAESERGINAYTERWK